MNKKFLVEKKGKRIWVVIRQAAHDPQYEVGSHIPSYGKVIEIAGPDLTVANHGSLIMVTPQTPEGSLWIDANVPLEDWQWFGGGFAVEPRYADALLLGAINDGLEVA